MELDESDPKVKKYC